MILRTSDRRVKQIVMNRCIEEPYAQLKLNGKYVDELIELPGGDLIVVEEAERPKARDGRQALETLRKLAERNKRVVAVVIVGKRGFDRRDKGLIEATLMAECQKRRARLFLKVPGQTVKVGDFQFMVVNRG